MLYEIVTRLRAKLEALGVPFPVVYGPEPTETTSFDRTRIVVEHVTAGDAFGPSLATHRVPRATATRVVGVVARIVARSPVTGAAIQDHERLAEDILDRVVASLDHVIRGELHTTWKLDGGGFVRPDDLEGSTTWGGALYELRFTFDRAVEVRKWPTAASPEGTQPTASVASGFVTSTTKVSSMGTEEAPAPAPETACG